MNCSTLNQLSLDSTLTTRTNLGFINSPPLRELQCQRQDDSPLAADAGRHAVFNSVNRQRGDPDEFGEFRLAVHLGLAQRAKGVKSAICFLLGLLRSSESSGEAAFL
jgi:hypothetical protein